MGGTNSRSATTITSPLATKESAPSSDVYLEFIKKVFLVNTSEN